MSERKEELVEVALKVPKNVVKALKEFILKYDGATELEYWKNAFVQRVIADVDFFCNKQHLDPETIYKKYDLQKYR